MEMFIILFGVSTIILSGGMLATNYVIMRKITSVAEDIQGIPQKVKTFINLLVPEKKEEK